MNAGHVRKMEEEGEVGGGGGRGVVGGGGGKGELEEGEGGRWEEEGRGGGRVGKGGRGIPKSNVTFLSNSCP